MAEAVARTLNDARAEAGLEAASLSRLADDLARLRTHLAPDRNADSGNADLSRPIHGAADLDQAMNATLLTLRAAATSGVVTLETVTVEPSGMAPARTETTQKDRHRDDPSSIESRWMQRSLRARGRYVSIEGLLDVLTHLPPAQSVLTGIDLVEDRFAIQLVVLGLRS